jgi:hypothetical protein
MSKIPGRRPLNKFDRTYRGSFGRFQTNNSSPLNYLLTSLRVSDIRELSTASEVFDLDTIPFDELIQRDIDQARVRRIANEYLRGGRNRAVFFPPLIACVALLDGESDGSRLKNQYESVTEERQDDELITTFDLDGFQLKLHAAESTYSDRRISWNGESVSFFDYAAELSLNSRRTKLVVLDGQHRLEALRSLDHTIENKQVISSIELPICIVWPPKAQVGANNESIITEFRDLFVTINTEPQRVSGHFILLLRDTSYTAMVVRELADNWKGDKAGGWSRLHLLEWNTREDERVDQRTRSFSITTISIVARVLRAHLFEHTGLAATLLDLNSRHRDLHAAQPDFDAHSLDDDTQAPAIDGIVRDQIRRRLLPALNTLLREFRPYKTQEAHLGAAFERMKQEMDQLNPACTSLHNYLARFIYSPAEMFDSVAPGAYADFRAWAAVPELDQIYFLSVFQQAFLRFWLRIAYALSEVCPVEETALCAVKALEAFAAKVPSANHTLYLSSEQPYCGRVLWKNESVNFSPEWARTAWVNALLATLLRGNVRAAALEKIPTARLTQDAKERLDQRLQDIGLAAAREYAERLWEETLRETRNNLGDHFGEIRAGQLREIKQTNLKEFEQAVSAKAQDRYQVAVALFANRLDRRTEELTR